MDRQLVPHSALHTVSQNLQNWLTYDLADSSIKMYKYSISSYQHFASEKELDIMDAQTMREWRDWMLLTPQEDGTFKSSNTINRMMSAIKRIIKEAQKRKLIDRSIYEEFRDIEGVKIDPDKLKPHARTRIKPEDMRRLCEMPNTATLVGLRDRALLHTLASSGIRASELATLKQSQIEEQEGGYVLKVRGKNEIKPVSAFLSKEAHTSITAWLIARPIECEYIFTSFTGRGEKILLKPITPQAIWNAVQKYASRCELEHIKPHDFRRFVGTILAKEDIRLAQKALRHKRIQTTVDHYVLDELEAGKTDNMY